jgi:soluble lytic murein transglycosylase-like protein
VGQNPPMPNQPGAELEPFGPLFRAELTRRPGRLLVACVATILSPIVAVTTTNARAVIPSEAAAEITSSSDTHVRGAVAAGPADRPDIRDGWLAGARRAAATCPGLPPEVLVAIGHVETRQGAATGPSSAGAMGPMQFLPATWEAYGADGDGDGVADVMNLRDALHGAARLLCANGGADPNRLRSAIWNYNRSHDYVDSVVRAAGLAA